LHPLVVPVGKCENDLFIVQVLVRIFRVMYDQRSAKSVGILASLVAVVPICAWLVDLHASQLQMSFGRQKSTYREVVRKRAPRHDRALRDRNRAIHMRRSVLVQTMKMQRRALVAQRVLDIDNDTVSFRSDNGFNRPLAIDAHDRARLLAIRIRVRPCDVEVVCDSCAMSDGSEERYRKEEAG
jgi:hypothetical protein